jgi:adenosine/AMP kinase
MDYKIDVVKIVKPESVNVIVGQAHFIKVVEDLFEACVSSVPGIRCGIAFCEASGACKIRLEGTDASLIKLVSENAAALACGHTFLIALDGGAYPINILNAVKNVPEVCGIFCATANALEVVVLETSSGRGIIGVVDGSKPKGIEDASDIAWRRDLLRKMGYKR